MDSDVKFLEIMDSTSPSHTKAHDSFFKPDSVGSRVAVALIVATAIAWSVTYCLMNSIFGMGMNNGMVSSALPIADMSILFSSLNLGVFLLFVLAWIAGTVAMMFPGMIPAVSVHYRMADKIGLSSKVAKIGGTMIFLLGYLIPYILLGLGAYLTVFLAFRFGAMIPSLSTYAAQVAGVIMMVAGVWQLTPYKDVCVKHYVSPLGFVRTHAKNGFGGAFRNGAEHGYYCVGSCYLYMIVMLSVAAMTIPSMALLAIITTLEKVIVKGAKWFTWLVGFGFIIMGVIIWFLPRLLPAIV
jgi:predicted metal-binding membrane protein